MYPYRDPPEVIAARLAEEQAAERAAKALLPPTRQDRVNQLRAERLRDPFPDLFATSRHDLVASIPIFNNLSVPKILPSGLGDDLGFYSAKILIRPGAFDTHLAFLESTRYVRLLLDHDDKVELANTLDGSLVVWADDTHIAAYVRGTTKRGAEAIRLIREKPHHRELSAGWTGVGRSLRRHDPIRAGNKNDSIVEYKRARLNEISLVRSGAFSGSKVEFI
ncbi:MAG: HK97 family phage prohead protease [Planctomycetes bacterium]|nr:HK97 family phage prohead protease [Planctomycetota bacterium]